MSGSGKKVLVAAQHTGSANSLVPVIRRLAEEDKVEIAVFCPENSKRIFETAAIPFRALRDVSSVAMERLLNEEKPNLILTGTSCQDQINRYVIEQSLILAAAELSIPSLGVVDFWGNVGLRYNDIFTGEKLKFLPDTIAVLDGISCQEHLEEGIGGKKLVITGNPHFDNLAQRAKNFTDAEKKRTKGKITLGNYSFLIFFAGSVFSSEKETFGFWDIDVLRVIVAALEAIAFKEANASFVIKTHPGMSEADKKKIGAFLSVQRGVERIALVETIPTQDLILASDLTVVSVSTVGAEAVLMGKPCISLQPGLIKRDEFLLSKHGIVPVAYSSDDCRLLLEIVVRDRSFREQEMLKMAVNFRSDGKATERVVNLIYEMLS